MAAHKETVQTQKHTVNQTRKGKQQFNEFITYTEFEFEFENMTHTLHWHLLEDTKQVNETHRMQCPKRMGLK